MTIKRQRKTFKTENTLGMPKTRTESLYVFEKGTGNKQLVQSFLAELVVMTDRHTNRQTDSDNMPHFMHYIATLCTVPSTASESGFTV